MIDIAFITLIGLILGSFLSALTYRMPKGISIARGRSFCPHCHRTIVWQDNIPLLSFLILGGKCRSCKKPISLRYPLIEGATALMFLLFAILAVSWWIFPIGIILLAIFVIDSEHQIIPDELIFTGLLWMIFIFLSTSSQLLYINLLSGLVAASFLLIIHFLTHGRGMGMGDVKFAVLGGLIAGWPFTLIWVFLSFIIGGIIGIILLLAGTAQMKDRIAFGPFLVIGLLTTMLFGKMIYAHIFGI